MAINYIPNNIPERTIERLSEYRRTLLDCLEKGITHLYSHTLAGMHGITAVQVRRDLMLIGFSCDTKKGYDARVLVDFIGGILDAEEVLKVAVIGMGNIGQAVTQYFTGKCSKLKITAAFDVDPEKVGRLFYGIPCYPVKDMVRLVRENGIKIAILSAPASAAPGLVGPIVESGISGALNFTSAPLNFPEGIYVENYDIITLLEKVAYFVKECDREKRR